MQTSLNAMSNFSLFAKLQRYIPQTFIIGGNGKKSFNPIPDPDADPDHKQHLITFKLSEV